MPSGRRQKPAQAPRAGDSAHVSHVYGEDELPLSDGPDAGEPVEEDRVEDEERPALGVPAERADWSTMECSVTPSLVRCCSGPPSYTNTVSNRRVGYSVGLLASEDA